MDDGEEPDAEFIEYKKKVLGEVGGLGDKAESQKTISSENANRDGSHVGMSENKDGTEGAAMEVKGELSERKINRLG